MEMKMAIDWRRELRNQRIVELWKAGKTSTEIAAAMGMTRSAIMGVVSRHGERKTVAFKRIGPKATKTRIVEIPCPYNPSKSIRKRVRLHLNKSDKYIGISEPFVNETYVETEGKKILDLGPFDCRWIFDDNSYCAQPKTFRSYCAHHAKIVYVPLLKKEKPHQEKS
jgi:hypothetical protein